MDDSQIDRIESSVSAFYDSVKSSLQVRLRPWSEYESSRQRSEGLAEQMIEIGNISIDLEERLSMMLVIQQHMSMMWDECIADYIARHQYQASDKFRAFKEMVYGAMSQNSDIHQLKTRVDACVEAGKRGVDRLHTLHSIASRAAGIAQGQQ